MTDHTLGDGPIEPEFRAVMNDMARAIDRVLNGADPGRARENGYVLLTFKFGDHPGRCNFISNGADRADIVVLFKELIARFEGQPDLTGRA
jgi:hypothetical protein